MKMRHGFVSNSSSSSFIVIGTQDYEVPKQYSGLTFSVFEEGELEFGWQDERFDDVYSRINFAWLQAKYRDEWLEMLLDVLKENLGCNCIVELDKSAYIDHQSSACEGENTEMFQTKGKLTRFLFSPDSYIQGGNDNS